MTAARVHPTAIVERGVELAGDVEIGPYCVVHAGAKIGRGSRLAAHVVVSGHTTIGEDNSFFPFCAIGGDAQLAKKGDEGASGRPRLDIGDGNVFREHVTINVGSLGRTTRIGARNLFMAGAHVAHDVVVGSRCVVANAVQLAGHVVVEDFVTFGGLSGCAQFVHVGESAFVAAGAMCERDVPPFVIVQGDRARVRALNRVGLERRGLGKDEIARLEAAYRALFGKGTTRSLALASIDRSDPRVDQLARALERG